MYQNGKDESSSLFLNQKYVSLDTTNPLYCRQLKSIYTIYMYASENRGQAEDDMQ